MPQATHFKITSTPLTFRRAGLQFSREPSLVALDQLTRDQIKALKAEPMLNIEEISSDTGKPKGDVPPPPNKKPVTDKKASPVPNPAPADDQPPAN